MALGLALQWHFGCGGSPMVCLWELWDEPWLRVLFWLCLACFAFAGLTMAVVG